jgi:hydroxymethylbilane synthase
MGLESRIKSVLSADESLPAVGQGALGIEVRIDDAQAAEWLAPLIDPTTQINVAAERQFSQRLGGSCSVPLGCFATHEGDKFEIEGLLAQPDGKLILRAQRSGKTEDALSIADALADDLFAQGAQKILDELEHA